MKIKDVMIEDLVSTLTSSEKADLPLGEAIEWGKLTWPIFIEFIEWLCAAKGWSVEYEDLSDESVAIFSTPK